MHGAGISPCNAVDMCNDDGCIDLNEEEDENYLPTPAYKKLIQATWTKSKTRNPKVTFNSTYFAFFVRKHLIQSNFPGAIHRSIRRKDEAMQHKFPEATHVQLLCNTCHKEEVHIAQ
jgi:hypothetical protein